MAATFSTLRPRGVPFQPKRPKTPGSGRRKGVQNVMTRSVREGIAEAARRLGDVARLVEWAMEDPINERIFWSQIWVRLIPLTIHGGGPRGEIEHSLTLTTRADVLKALQERNLPPDGLRVRPSTARRDAADRGPRSCRNGNPCGRYERRRSSCCGECRRAIERGLTDGRIPSPLA